MPENQSVSNAESKDAEQPKRRGPRPAAEVRAEVEAEKQAEIAKIEAEKEAEINDLRAQLTAMQESIAALTSQQKETAADQAVSAPKGQVDPKASGAIQVHFVDDGLTLDGQVRYRGEEYVLDPKHENYDQIAKILNMDEYAQEDRWGRQFFRPGPWRGKKFIEISDADMVGLSDEAKAELIAAQQKARQKA
jgi:hypothetical protein